MDSKFYPSTDNEWLRYAELQQYKSDSYDDFTRYNDGMETLQSLYHKQKLSASQLPYTTRLSRQDVGGGPGVYDSLADLIPPTRPLPRHPTMCPLTHNGNMIQEQDQDLLMDSFTGSELTPFNNPTSYEPSFPKMFHDVPQTGGGENVEEKFSSSTHQMAPQMRPSVIMTSSQQSHQFRMVQGLTTSDNNNTKPSSQSNNGYTEKSLKVNTEQQKIGTAQKTSTTSSGKTRTKDKYRTVYSEVQKAELERQYVTNTYITAQRKADISRLVALSERQVKIWFQNRRAKDRKYRNKRNVIHTKELDRSMTQDVPSRFLSHSTGAMFPPGEATMPNIALPHSVLGLRAMQQNSAMMVENNSDLVNRYNVMNNELFT